MCEHFREIFDVCDNVGRSPLHYAALRDDGGDFYNLLVSCGAGTFVKDSVSLIKRRFNVFLNIVLASIVPSFLTSILTQFWRDKNPCSTVNFNISVSFGGNIVLLNLSDSIANMFCENNYYSPL